ncbi:3-beta hydroxysteroid dehydrogenase [Longimycelium tulufanense]|uniref:3-beta hydroxysteroid dehydrogenase n=1 Tax=Longimycelium tulufanense TaxID=907463 RepID=A0A8J3CCS1_9PSEU|nr:3-beta hydroxysteroid dehydrogenase [Longimycelium tulufanense]
MLVTGASGFLGSHIVDECLQAGHQVRALVKRSSDRSYLSTLRDVELHYGDLTDPVAVREATRGVSVVHHSAARVTDYGSRRQFWDTNVLGTRLLLNAARDNGVRTFVFVSTPSAVMTGGDQLDITEDQPYPQRHLNLYSETKAAAERIVLQANDTGFRTCAIRPRGVWGPRDWHGFMPRLVAKMRAGRLPDLSGGRKVLTSLCHCRNAALGCVQAAESEQVGGRAYFVADRERTDVWALLAEVARMFCCTPPNRRVPPLLVNTFVELVELVWRVPYIAHRYSPPLSRYSLALLTRSTTYDTSAAERDFGYRPVVSQEAGLRELVRWVADIGGVDRFTQYVR